MSSKHLLVISSFFVFASANAGSFHPLGFLGGNSPSIAYAVSGDGNTVVGMSNSPQGFQAFKWTEAGGMAGLGMLSGAEYPFSTAFGVNADGSVIVGASDNGWAGEEGTAVRWTSAGIQWLGSLGGPSTYGQAEAVSADGSVIVGKSETPNGIEAFKWTATTGMVSLGDLPGGLDFSGAFGISSDGHTIGGAATTHSYYYPYAPVSWNDQGGPNVFPGDEGSIGDLSGDGQTLVGSNGNAVKWTASGMETIVVSQGGTTSSCTAVSADGSVIVGYRDYSAYGGSQARAFIWIAGQGAQDLDVVAANAGINLNGFTLGWPLGISADGRVICGMGGGTQGQEAWVLNLRNGQTNVMPTSVSLSPGRVVSGTPQNLYTSDNQYYTLAPGIVLSSSQSPIVVNLSGSCTTNSPSSLRFVIESRVQQGNIRQTIDAFDFVANAYVQIDQRTLPISTQDIVLSLPLVPTARFVGPANEVRARVSYKAVGPVLSYPWGVLLDETTWRCEN